MGSSLCHQDLTLHGLLSSVMSQGKQSHRLTRSCHNVCLPSPICSNPTQNLHGIWACSPAMASPILTTRVPLSSASQRAPGSCGTIKAGY